MGLLSSKDCGLYDFILAVGEVESDRFVSLYSDLFFRRSDSEQTVFLINIEDHPSVLGVEGFTHILAAADEYGIGHIEMMIFSTDENRPIIGKMVEELAKSFAVTIRISFYQTLKQAQAAVDAFVKERFSQDS